MAGNPVFRKFERETRSGQYAGFDSGSRASGPAGWGSQAPLSGAGGAWGHGGPQTGRGTMTLDDVMVKALNLFGLLLVVSVASFVFANRQIDAGAGSTVLGMWAMGGLVSFLLSLVIGFKKTISVPLILLFTVFEGVFLGAVSAAFNVNYPGLVVQAILATICVFGGVFLGYRTGLIKVTARSRRVFMYMVIGYSLFALVNLVLVLTGLQSGFGIGGSGPLGIAISVFAVGLASYSLAVDFDSIQSGVAAGVPEKTAWLLAYGLMVSVVWLYVEMLRLLARLRD